MPREDWVFAAKLAAIAFVSAFLVCAIPGIIILLSAP
jgi:hypothetical protein